MMRKRAKSADQTSLGTPWTTETAGALRKSASGLRGTPPSAIVRAVPEFIWGMSAGSMLIDGLSLIEKGGERELSANIDQFRVWFRVPADVQLMESADPFLAIGLLEALSRGGTIKIDPKARISKPLLSNIEILNLIYCNWNGDFKSVRFDCSIADPRSPIPGVATMYSAGVDSTYTLLRHEDEITQLVRIFGIDLRPDNPEQTAQIIEHDTAYATEVGKHYIPVRTNIREYANKREIIWESYWGFPLYAVALALGFSRYIFPSSYTYSELHPASGHPLTDPLWGNGQIEIIHDICIRRSEKLKHIVKSPHSLSRLHMCWLLPIENCGYCSKCVRTAIALHILGAKADNIPASSALEILRKQRIGDDLTFFMDNLLLAQEYKDHEVYRILKKAITRYERRKTLSEIDRNFLGGVLRRLHRHLKKPDRLSFIRLESKEHSYY